jgi:hypothetical protein
MPSPAERYEQKLAMHGSELAYNDDGVDLTLIRAALARTPIERLQHHEATAASVRWMLEVAVPVKRDAEAV